MMADNQLLDNVGGRDDIFVYTGGQVPRHVTRARICKSIDTIPYEAFAYCEHLIEVKGHNKIKKIEEFAFNGCTSLKWVKKMNGVQKIGKKAFKECYALREVHFDKLKIIGKNAFANCYALRHINMSSVRRVGDNAFYCCEALSDVVFGKDLEGIGQGAFYGCASLRCIAVPLKPNVTIVQHTFDFCEHLSRVDVIGEDHETISSLHMESWRDEMNEEIGGINRTLSDTPGAFVDGVNLGGNKTRAIQRWFRSVIGRLENYKANTKC